MRRLIIIAACVASVSASLVGQGSRVRPFVPLRTQATNSSNRYIVVLRSDIAGHPGPSSRAGAIAQALAATHQLVGVERVLSHAINGMIARLTTTQATALANDPQVAYVEQEVRVGGGAVQLIPASGVNWGLDRINQTQLPVDGQYQYDSDGSGVTAYIVDSGIRVTHVEFGGRAVLGPNFVSSSDVGNPNPGTALDCYGHGTHVAGIVGGATFGVAKNVTLVAVRVLDCNGGGSSLDVISAIDWVTQDHSAHYTPAVANLSVTTGVVPPSFTAIEDAIASSLDNGVTWVLVAGNNADTVAQYSPGRMQPAITVAASSVSGGIDIRADFSNTGPEVDLYAPGVDITSAFYTSDTATATGTGTSMAAPQVTGVVARFLQTYWWAPPAHVLNQVVLEHATPNMLADPGPNTANRLLYSGFLDDQAPAPSVLVRPVFDNRR